MRGPLFPQNKPRVLRSSHVMISLCNRIMQSQRTMPMQQGSRTPAALLHRHHSHHSPGDLFWGERSTHSHIFTYSIAWKRQSISSICPLCVCVCVRVLHNNLDAEKPIFAFNISQVCSTLLLIAWRNIRNIQALGDTCRSFTTLRTHMKICGSCISTSTLNI